jgi:hypothetical protein
LAARFKPSQPVELRIQSLFAFFPKEKSMRWTPGGESQDIEDRRDESDGGGGFQFGGLHIGIGGAISS